MRTRWQGRGRRWKRQQSTRSPLHGAGMAVFVFDLPSPVRHHRNGSMRGKIYEIRTNPDTPGGAPPGGRVESVSGLTRRIKSLLESSLPAMWVRGEISNLRAQASGHLYFSLKDEGAQISCVMFRGDRARGGHGVDFRDGAQILVYGQISVYEPRGNYQLIVRAAVDDGAGRLQQEFERLKKRLAAEGLFDRDRKAPLPDMPRTVGFITSPTGAAVQDFIRILKRRHWRGRLIVLPTRVQGAGAAAEMIEALNLAETLTRSPDGPSFDLLVIGRGGGSIEDLWEFNNEALVRTIAGCAIPIISAVGHEIDFTLADFAADIRAETPSAAAELISSRYLDVLERLRQAADALDDLVAASLQNWRDDLEHLRAKMRLLTPASRVEHANLRLDDLASRLSSSVRHRLDDHRTRLAALARRLQQHTPEPLFARASERLRAAATRLDRETAVAVAKKQHNLDRLAEHLRSLGPDSTLRRGFAIISDQTGRPVTSAGQIHSGDRVKARFHDGEHDLTAD